MSTHNIPLFYRRLKRHGAMNNPQWLELAMSRASSMMQKMFDPLKFGHLKFGSTIWWCVLKVLAIWQIVQTLIRTKALLSEWCLLRQDQGLVPFSHLSHYFLFLLWEMSQHG